MKKLLTAIFILAQYCAYTQGNAYQKAWSALSKNKRSDAERLFAEAIKDPSSFRDAYISNIYLKSYNGKDEEITDFAKSFYSTSDNASPYVYALWFNQAVMGNTGKKHYDHQIKMVDILLADAKANGTIVASANYQKGMHNLFSNDFDKTQRYFDAVGNIKNWQYAGPFENLSGSGFYKLL